ncbi:MAG TPA: TIGR04282 family arsenosugar biosynthesis glycosyltransferase [Burkholderiales bacterium]
MIIVFARAPVPGQAKTRLIPRLGAWRAARLQARLTLAALRTARAARCGPVELHGTSRHAFFEGRGTFRLQRGADLGERMQRAFRAALRRHRRVILIGSDCPVLRAADLRLAARWLRGGCDAVLAPAQDGGYALIGLRRLVRGLFDGIPWGEAGVYSATRARLAGRRWRALRTVWDVDRPDDLQRLESVRF